MPLPASRPGKEESAHERSTFKQLKTTRRLSNASPNDKQRRNSRTLETYIWAQEILNSMTLSVF